jgi:hypothetical protein
MDGDKDKETRWERWHAGCGQAWKAPWLCPHKPFHQQHLTPNLDRLLLLLLLLLLCDFINWAVHQWLRLVNMCLASRD